MWNVEAANNVVAGNYIGTDITGAVTDPDGIANSGDEFGNRFEGIHVGAGAHDNLIGTDADGMADAAERNVISGNLRDGIQIQGVGGNHNVVAGNFVGINADGNAPLGNLRDGIRIENGAAFNLIGSNADTVHDAAERNVISANADRGVRLTGADVAHNIVAGNFIGVDLTGTTDLGNAGAGIHIAGARDNLIGGSNPGSGNIIAGNTTGMNIGGGASVGNRVQGNRIGTTADGTTLLGWANFGIIVHNGASTNYIGTDGDGIDDEKEGNVIARASVGISFQAADGNVVAGNLIGTNADGSAPLGNNLGVWIVSGARSNRIGTNSDGVSDTFERNVISANAWDGIRIQGAATDKNLVAGNYIGLAADGVTALENGHEGVKIQGGAQRNRIGTFSGSRIVVEAESFTSRTSASGRDWLIIPDEDPGVVPQANARGGQYLQVLPDLGGNNFEPLFTNGPVASYHIQIEEPGEYQLYVRWDGHSGTSDSINARIAELTEGTGGAFADWYMYSGGAHNDANFATDSWQGEARAEDTGFGSAVVPAVWNIDTPGVYTVQFTHREDAVAFDSFVLQPAHLPGPIGNEPVESPVDDNGSFLPISISAAPVVARNIIAGNSRNGVRITDAGSSENIVAGNYIGLNATGAVVGNADNGILIENGASANQIGANGDGVKDLSERNVISGNGDIWSEANINIIGGHDNIVAGNYIGTNAGGDAGLPNVGRGVRISDGSSGNVIGTDGSDDSFNASERNIISGHSSAAVFIAGNSNNNVVAGNYVGLDASGTIAIGNAAEGISISGSTGNRIGTNADAIADALERNVVVANDTFGIQLADPGTELNTIAGNFIGVGVDGSTAFGNAFAGIGIANGAIANTIGGSSTAERNLISGNAGPGVSILRTFGGTTYAPSPDNIVRGNFIGTDLTGAIPVANQNAGIWIEESGTLVDANVISGNQSFGVLLAGDNAVVSGNYIGTNAVGTAAIPNADDGIRVESGSNNIIGGSQAASRNVISGNANDGIAIHGATDTVVAGNYVGLDVSGSEPLGNAQSGIFITSGALNTQIGTDGDGLDDAAERNVISDNSITGVRVSGAGTDHTVIAGNYVGVDASGAAAIGNRQASGIVMENGARFTRVGTDNDDPREGNVVVGAGEGSDVGVAIWVIFGDASDNAVAGNYVGLNASGNASIGHANAGIAVASANNVVDDNRIGAHLQFGVGVYGSTATGNTLRRNYVGTDATGTLVQGGNPLGGVFLFDGVIASPSIPGTPTGTVIGGDRLADGNLISGNSGPGIELFSPGITDTEILGNFIGTSRSAAQDLGNAGAGVHVATGVTSTRIGSIASGLGNTIAFNSTGVVVLGSETTVRGNAIFSNDAFGIDLDDDGVTSNDLDDTDGGPNNLQNYPTLSSATAGAFTNVKGQLQSTPNSTFDVDFYKSPDPAGSSAAAQGRRFLGSTSVTTDAAGVAAIDATFAAGSVADEIITAIVTDTDGNSSEFSAAVAAVAELPVTIDPDQLILTEVLDDEGYGDPASTFIEGSRVRLDGLFVNNEADDTHTIDIDWGDGSEPLTLVVAPGIRGFAAEHVYDDDRPSGTAEDDYVINIFVIDDDGSSGAASTMVTIANEAPVFSQLGLSASSGNEGDTLHLEGTFVDAGRDAHQLIIDWGDGSASQTVAIPNGDRSFSIPHTFADQTDSISVRLLDDDTGETVTDLPVTIRNLPPVPAISGPTLGVEGSQINLTASAPDPGTLDIVELSWQVSTSGRLLDSGTGSNISFSPPDQGTYTVSVTASDEDDGAATVTHTIAVSNAPPEIDAASVELVDEAGDPVSVAIEGATVRLIGDFVDPGIEDRHVIQVNWGDGSPTTSVPLAHGATSFDVAHVYADDTPSGTSVDSYAVTVVVSGLDGGIDEVSRSVDVANADPQVMLVDNGSDSNTVRLRAKVDDPSLLDTFTYQWQVDGDPFATAPGDAIIEFDRPATGSGTVSVTVTDDDGGIGSATAVFVAGTDEADEVTIAPSETDPTKLSVTVTTTDSTTSQDVDFAGQLVVATGDSNDKITIDPSLDIDAYIDGGAGDDEITTGDGNNTIDISEGDDTLHSGSGNDTIIISGFSNKTITDNGGIDTLDFSGVQPSAIFGEGVTLDLGIDDGTPQLIRSDGTISLLGTFEHITGTDFHDKFTGNAANNRFFGGSGEDTIVSGTGEDSIDGGDGNDLIFGGDFDDDSIGGGTSDDSVSGGEGNDLIFGGSGDDSIYSGSGSDSIDGGDGNDLIFGRGAPEVNLYGGTGDDTIVSGGGEDTIDGGDGNDLIFGGGGGSAQVYGGLGDDTINAGSGDDSIDGGEGNDLIFGRGAPEVNLYGGIGDDTIVSGGGEDTIDGGDGNDLIFGGGGGTAQVYGGLGDDTINAGSGDDSVDGGEGNDLIYAGGDSDTIDGSSSNDSISGGEGNDLIFGGYGGDDTIDGGAGDDTILGGDGNDLIFGGDGDDSISGSTSDSDSLDGGAGNDLIFASTDTDAVLTADRLTVGAVETHFTGFEAAALYGDESDNRLDASDTALPVKLVGGGGNDTLLGGSNNDVLQTDAGSDLLVGGGGDDIYLFTDASSGDKTITESLAGGEDTLNFQSLSRGITLDLSLSDAQTIVTGLTVALAGDIENAFGTDASDTLRGNSLNNKLSGYGGHDHLEGGDGVDVLQAGGTRQVFLDFDSATEAGEYAYSQEVRDAIQLRMEEDYAAFDVVFSQSPPVSGSYVTVFFNAAVTSVPGGGRVLGGISDRIGWRELSGSGVVKVDVNGFFQSTNNKLPATNENYIALSSTIASHELGHSYGLRHHDAFGAPGSGIYQGLNPARFRPAFTGPAAADETRLHLSASPASVGTTLIDALGNPFFGEREALKLAFAESGVVTNEWDAAEKETHALADGTNWLVQTLGTLAPLAVPNTIEQGINAGVTLVAAAETVIGSIELANGTSESDFYSFTANAGDVVTIELMSQVLRHRISNPIDSLLRVYDSAGEVLDYHSSSPTDGGTGAFNDDSFEPTDSLLLDLVLPQDGTYTIEVDTFSFGIPELDAYLGGLDTASFCAVNAAHTVCADNDTGDYELLIYRFDNSGNLGDVSGDTLIGGAGADQLIGNSGSQTFLGFNPNEDLISDRSPSSNIVNAAPQLQPIDEPAGVEGTQLSFLAPARDDDGDTLSWALEELEPVVVGNAVPNDAFIDPATGMVSFTPPDDGLYRARVVVTETLSDGSTGQSDTQDYFISVANVDPTGSIDEVSEPRVEGTAISIAASATDPAGESDTLTYTYEVTKDGDPFDSGRGVDLTSFSFTPDDNGSYNVTLTISDEDGGNSESIHRAFDVLNADPVPVIETLSSPRIEGTEIEVTASATDPGEHDTLTFDYEIDKNGATFLTASDVDPATFRFTPDDDGDYEIRLTVTDNDGGSTTTTQSIAVANADPEAQIDSFPSAGFEGQPVTVVASASDPAGANDILTFHYAVFKDGASDSFASSSGENQTSFSFTPDDNGSYVVVLTVDDEDGGTTSVNSATIEIANVAPVLDVIGVTPSTIEEGDSVSVSGNVTDAGSADVLTVSIEWGDGTSTASVPVDVNGDFVASHLYLDNPTDASTGDYTITIIAADDDSDLSPPDNSLVVTVSNVAPVIQNLVIDDASANATGTIHFTADFTDAGISDTHTATVDWGDGAVESAQLSGSSGVGSISGTHAYDIGGDYVVTLTVADNAGAETQHSVLVHVNRTGVFLVDGQLRIFGTPDADKVFILKVSSSLRVHADFHPGDHWQTFSASEVDSIWVETLHGDDYVHLVPTVFIPSTIDVGPGNDIVLGGSGPDLIDGGGGDDHLSGRWGDDTIHGGAGNDKLWGSFGDDVLDGGDGDDRLWGNAGNDVLIGGGGDDQLHGGTGRDLMIGGDGSDRLKGDTNDDILIGGTTAFDNHRDALATVMAEWTSDRTYAERVSNLRDGTGTSERANGGTFLQADITVFDDGDEDWMLGGSGLDWFFALDEDENEDTLKDDRWHEQVDLLFADEGA